MAISNGTSVHAETNGHGINGINGYDTAPHSVYAPPPNATACAPLTGASRLRQLLADPDKVVVCPGVFDGLTARIALAAGFDAIYMTGAGTSMSRLGWADLGLATQTDMVTNASMLASLSPGTPLIADADTGYGGPIMVSRTIAAYSRAGVAALHIEDQIQEKRCGHLLGKQIVEREVYYSKLRAAVQARDALGSDMLIIARTDSRQGMGFDEAVERLQEAIRIGVDVVFFEAMQSKDEMRRVCEIFRDGVDGRVVPLLLNNVPGGATPNVSVKEAKEMGFRIMIYPGACIEPVIQAVSRQLAVLKTDGVLRDSAAGSLIEAFDLCGLQECINIDKNAGGKQYDGVVK